MASALSTTWGERRYVSMMISYNKDPHQYNWRKFLTKVLWLAILLSVLANIIKVLTEE